MVFFFPISRMVAVGVQQHGRRHPLTHPRNTVSLSFVVRNFSTFPASVIEASSSPQAEEEEEEDSTKTTTTQDNKANRFFREDAWRAEQQRPIFVAATRQHVGKTTVSLALVSGLQKRFGRVGFIKPVGQHHVPVVSDELEKTIKVDKDVCLVREKFHLEQLDYRHMSPVIIPQGYTKKYVDGEITYEDQLRKIESSFQAISDRSDIVLCEGTGHCAVGSIVDVNNAKVAKMLGADMILVANGGLGSTFDELELNRVLCHHYNVAVAGVIVNKVDPQRYEQTKYYLGKAIWDRWGIPLLGCIPDRPFLGCPALADLETLFGTQLISGTKFRFRHYGVNDINLVTTSLSRFLENLRDKPPRTLYICHKTRDDLILGFVSEYQRRRQKDERPFEAALLICGRKNKYEISREVRDMISGLEEAPILLVETSTSHAMTKIHDFTPKLHIDDRRRVETAVNHYEPYINFDEVLRRTTDRKSSFSDPSTLGFAQLRRL